LAWRIEFDAGALKDLRRLDRQVAHRITRFLRERLGVMDDPRSLGARLKGPRSGPGTASLWRYRVGDWRIVAHIEDEVLRVLVLRIAHRREVCRRG
jgi:mRNA interferase RelE/StbE